MKIISIDLSNYRQYKGDHKVELSIDNSKNLTVLVGANGAGKTNLMNAVTWCLYGQEKHLSSGVKERMMPIANENALAGTPPDGLVTTEVTVTFGSLQPQYILKRTLTTWRHGDILEPTENFKILWLSNGTDWEEHLQPSYFMNSFLPEAVSEFFFFDGERLDKFFATESKEVEKAILNISKISLLDEIIRHLDTIKGEVRREGKGASPQADLISKQIEDKKAERNRRQAELDGWREDKRAIEKDIKDVDEKLGGTARGKEKELQKEREELNRDVKDYQKQTDDLRRESVDHLVNDAPIVYMSEAMKYTLGSIKEKHESGELPPSIKETYLRELLQRGKCICGTDISVEGEHRSHVETLLSVAPLSAVDNEITEGKFQLESLLRRVEGFLAVREKCGKRISELEGKIKQKQVRLKEIDEILGSSDMDEIRSMEGTRRELLRNRDELITKMAVAESDIRTWDSQVGKLDADYEAELRRQQSQRILLKKLELVTEAHSTCVRAKQELVSEVRQTIREKTKKYFFSLIHDLDKFSDVTIDENYSLSVLNKYGRDIVFSLSAGEREILALSFIAALREISGFTAPMIIDTPWGRISQEVRNKIAKLLPEYLQDVQITVPATDTEYTPQVRSELKRRVGKEYMLKYEGEEQGTEVTRYG